MSLNDFFAGGVYLRPVGLPDCFPLGGLPHGCKPPPPPQLTMQHPCGAGPPQKSRSMAAVSPLHQVAVSSQANHLAGAYEASSAALNAFGPAVSAANNRTSSFAAALRKLAKQAGDPIIGEKDLTQISPVSSPALAQRSLTPKRNGGSSNGQPSMYLSSGVVNSNAHQITSYPSGSPPVVTIAPSRPHQAHTSDSRKLQVMDLSGLQQGNSTSGLSNGHLSDSLGLKLDTSSKSTTRTNASDKWEDLHVSKSLPTSSGSAQSRPHATIAPLPRPDDSMASSRGFQPYRSAEDIRTSIPHHLSPFEQHHPPSAYSYSPAFLPPPHIAHPAYRFEDPLFLDRYGLLRSSVMPFPGQPGMMTSPAAAFYPQSRYDLLAQSLSLSSVANNSLLHHERLKLEEERRLREKETELDHSRKREQERREKEQKEKEHREKEKESKRERNHREKAERSNNSNNDQHHSEHSRSTNHSLAHSKRNEHSVSRNDSIVHTTITTTATTNGHHSSTSPTSNSSAPLNLVVHPTPEQPKKEAELWVPWQHQPPNHHHHSNNQVKDIHEENGNGVITYRHSTPVVPENYRINVTKENTSPEKFHAPYNLPLYGDKKHPSVESNPIENESKKYVHHGNGNTKKFDSIHHHIAELSKKETNITNNNEWKHEKLQKACTNNHRKNVSEFKKLREETHQRKPQQHPIVNGVVKPVFHQAQIQDEGMHARLLETEKCRMSEYNKQHHANIKGGPLNPPSDKLLPPTLVPNNLQINGHDALSQKIYLDHNPSVLKHTTTESIPLISKLDKEAEDSKKKGTTDADGEEVPGADFLIITKGPPLKLDTNPKKMRFFKLLGLTSQLKRKKIEFDIYLKRRKLLHEDQVNKILIQPEEKITDSQSLWKTSQDLDRLSEKLRLEVKVEKLEFLKSLGLKPLTLAMKEEQTRLNKGVVVERKKREQRLKMKPDKRNNKQTVNGTKEEKENAESKESLTGEKEKASAKPKGIEKCSSQNVSAPGEQVPYTHAPELEDAIPCPENMELIQPLKTDAIPKIHNNNISKRRAKYSFKRGHSLKCEWKPPILTLMTPNNHFKDRPAIIKTEIKTDFHAHISTGTQVDLSFTSKNLLDKKDKNQKSFHWPGLDIIMEAYYRHNKEQLHEKEAIQEKCNKLRTQQEDLKKEANGLNKSMAELLKLKRELDDKRNHYEKAVEKLKQCMKIPR